MRRRSRFGSSFVILAVAVLGLTAAVFAGRPTQDIVAEIDEAAYRYNLVELLYTHPGDNRGFGPEHDLAQQNIFDTLASYGLEVSLDPFLYRGDTYFNVVAVKPGSVDPERQYIIGAHYDSVDNPGADDNGSGTAGVMEIARVLSQYEFESTIIFIAFDREEQGLYGSEAYAVEHSDDDIQGMVSMDMIAYNTGADSVDLYGRSASNPIKTALAQAVVDYSGGLNVVIEGALDASDHAPFEWEGFQACLIIEDWGNPYYHTQQDNVEMPDYIDYDFAVMVCRSVCGWLVDHAMLVVEACPADVDGSGTVDFNDLLLVLSAWGSCEACPEDVDGDGDVDFRDLLMVLAGWGPCE